MSSHLQEHYNDWRVKRIRKLESILGKEYFLGKRILEVGAGHGRIGKYLRESYGSTVDFTEGRIELVDEIRKNNPGAIVYHINHNEYWNMPNRYDLIIHWGLLYHLTNWQDDLKNSLLQLNPSGILALESEVLDNEDDTFVDINEDSTLDDQSLSGPAVRSTAKRIENELTKLGFTFTRYDDPDLNSTIHVYDWIVDNTNGYGARTRRFWVCRT